jgi:hypothetical protein
MKSPKDTDDIVISLNNQVFVRHENKKTSCIICEKSYNDPKE